MDKIDISKLSLDEQAFILTGMTFEALCEYVAINLSNEETVIINDNK